MIERRIITLRNFVLRLAVLCCWPLAAAGQGLLLSVNAAQLSPSDNLAVSLAYSDSAAVGAGPVDLYVAIDLPGSATLYFFPDFSITPAPWVRGWTPQAFAAAKFFDYRFSGAEPEGDYHIYAALAKAGGDLAGGIASVTARFTRTQGVLSSTPADGATVSVSPVFTVVFSGPVDLDSVLDHSEVTVTSQQSGKVATLYTGDWFGTPSRLVRLDYPNGTVVTSRLSAGTISLVNFQLSDDGKTLSLPFQPVTVSGTTFSLSSGGSYTFGIKFLTGARLSSGYSLAGASVGPIGFTVQ